jgi:di/tricarboxylate transporter
LTSQGFNPCPVTQLSFFALIAAAGVLMASNRVRFDIVALLIVLALMLSGILSVGQALSGFGNPVVITVAGLLVVGEMLDRTGSRVLWVI